MRSALIVGATGLVGSALTEQLLDDPDYKQLTVLARRPLQIQNPKFHGVYANFDKLEDAAEHFAVDDVFCCLGTTIGKAGSQQSFRKVDFDYVIHTARLAAEKDVPQFLVVSALGANPRSAVFYNRVKGEMEAALMDLKIRATHIFRPSLLLGPRDEYRAGEKIAQAALPLFSWLLIGLLRKYRAISADDVARAMIFQAKQNLSLVRTYESDVIQKIADLARKQT